MTPIGDGIYWSIASNLNCDQYTLTREQIEQKSEKKSRAKPYAVVKKYSGRWFPVVFGFKVLFSIPCTDENRLRLNVGDNVLVTRWRKFVINYYHYYYICLEKRMFNVVFLKIQELVVWRKDKQRGWRSN